MRWSWIRAVFLLVVVLNGAPELAPGASSEKRLSLLSLTPGTWYQVPNSRLDAVLPNPLPDVGYGSPDAITMAWNSGAFDPKRNRFYVLGGGHADYSGNEVYQFDLATLKWSRLTEPTPWASVPHFKKGQAASDIYADGRPASVHTYGMVQYLPTVDALWLQGGSRWHDGNGSSLAWFLDLTTLQWRHVPGFSRHLGLSSAYDPETNRVIAREITRYFAYDVAAGTYAWISGEWDDAIATYDGHSTAIHRATRMVVTIGKAVKNGAGGLVAFDLTRPPTVQAHVIPMSGDTEILSAYAPGLDYDEARQLLVAWMGGGDVYEIDLEARVVHKVPSAGGTPPGHQFIQGTFGRWRYVPGAGGFLYVGGIREPVYFYKTATAAAPPPLTSIVEKTATRTSDFHIPLKTWVARRLPGYGKGPTAGKHMRLAHNPVNGRIYFLGGDYSGPMGYDSGRNEVYSYSIADDTWRQEHPYCGPSGSVQPSHPDEVGWAWDSSRKIFWMVPGYMSGVVGDPCPQNLVIGKIMTFDPMTKAWTVPKRTLTGTGEAYKFASYDPVTDQIIRFAFGGQGFTAQHYDIKTDTYTTVVPVRTTNSVDVTDTRVNEEYHAIDVEGRVIYVIEPVQGKLFAYHLETKSLEFLVDTPVKNPRIEDANKEPWPWDCAMPIWDSVNKVLLWPHIRDFSTARITLYIYDPYTKIWEKDTMIQPEGLPVRGNSAVFDPMANALLVLGGTSPNNHYLFLYRYGNGVTRPPASSPRS